MKAHVNPEGWLVWEPFDEWTWLGIPEGWEHCERSGGFLRISELTDGQILVWDEEGHLWRVPLERGNPVGCFRVRENLSCH